MSAVNSISLTEESTMAEKFSRIVQGASSHEIIGDHEGIIRGKQLTEQAKGLRILFYGETGVGKTPFARYSNHLMAQAENKKRPFEQINCACLSPEHFQDQLFGHKKGAFTGAISDKQGLVEIAEGGDLFLDEIGDMPLSTQAHFLTFLDTMEYYRLGDDRKRRANVRVLCATNRNLKELVEEGKFRRDLFSRVSQVVVPIPSLRNRASDIPLLVRHFVRMYSGYDKAMEPGLLDILSKHDWRDGNVRELRDSIEYLCLMSASDPMIQTRHLGDRFLKQPMLNSTSGTATDCATSELDRVYEMGLESYLGLVEKSLLERLLQSHDGCMEKLARTLKTSRSTLYRRIRKYDGLTVA